MLAAELPSTVVQLHAHFLHTPASVTRYAALLRGLPWSCSAHAKDIWTTPEWEKREKLDSCTWITTCTEVNARHLRGLARPGRAVDLNYHGVDTRRFPPPGEVHGGNDGSDPQHPVRILAVGRAVDKKGFDDLLAALARLAPDRHWRLTHIGGGPMLRELATRHAVSALPDASSGKVRRRMPPYSTPIAPGTYSRCHAGWVRTATATACPMSCSKPRARNWRACRRASRGFPN